MCYNYILMDYDIVLTLILLSNGISLFKFSVRTHINNIVIFTILYFINVNCQHWYYTGISNSYEEIIYSYSN